MCIDNSQGTSRLEELLTGIKKKLKVVEQINDCVERCGSEIIREIFAGEKCSSDPTRDIIQFFEKEGEDTLREFQDRLQDLIDDIDGYQKNVKEMPSTEEVNTRNGDYVLDVEKKVKKYAELLQELSYHYELMHMPYVYGPEPSFVEEIRGLDVLDVGPSPFS